MSTGACGGRGVRLPLELELRVIRSHPMWAVGTGFRSWKNSANSYHQRLLLFFFLTEKDMEVLLFTLVFLKKELLNFLFWNVGLQGVAQTGQRTHPLSCCSYRWHGYKTLSETGNCHFIMNRFLDIVPIEIKNCSFITKIFLCAVISQLWQPLIDSTFIVLSGWKRCISRTTQCVTFWDWLFLSGVISLRLIQGIEYTITYFYCKVVVDGISVPQF